MSSRTESVSNTLASAIANLEKDQELRKQVKESLEPIEDLARSAWSTVNKIHSAPSAQHAAICEKSLEITRDIKPLWASVASLIPEGEFHRYSYAIGPINRSLTQTIVFSRFMLFDELTPAFTVSDLIGLEQDTTKNLILSAEDYLQGVISAVNELPRLSINAVTSQNFDLPVKISAFVNDIFSSYSLLNLRNDALRRRFDSLKYDLKRCEDVVYDLTLRGLAPAPKA